MRDLVEAVSFTYPANEIFMFGWAPAAHIVNRFTIHSIKELPALVAINSTNQEYILLNGPVLPQDLVKLLDEISSGTATFQGGNSYWSHSKRMIFDFTSSVTEMYRANPLLTILLFALPTVFFIFIMYSICFSDFGDASEGDEEEEGKMIFFLSNSSLIVNLYDDQTAMNSMIIQIIELFNPDVLNFSISSSCI